MSNCVDKSAPHRFKVSPVPSHTPWAGVLKMYLTVLRMFGSHADLLGAEPLLCNCNIKMTAVQSCESCTILQHTWDKNPASKN